MKRYYVISKTWDLEKERIVRYIAGEFSDITNASIFKAAYEATYSCTAVILTEREILEGVETGE